MSELVGDARQLPPSAQEALRMRAVAALVAGRDRQDVAELFKVSLKAVDNWWAKWLAGGREALVSQPRGRRVGAHQLLGEAEQQAIRQAMLDHRPCDLSLAGQLWTRAGVRDLIARLFRVRLTEQGVGKYLRRWGLSFQRPDKRAVEQDEEAVRLWREETWPAIRAKAKTEGGEVLFAEAAAKAPATSATPTVSTDVLPPAPTWGVAKPMISWSFAADPTSDAQDAVEAMEKALDSFLYSVTSDDVSLVPESIDGLVAEEENLVAALIDSDLAATTPPSTSTSTEAFSPPAVTLPAIMLPTAVLPPTP
ncbi:helix-turn-helix domain-containing protein [Streptomyces flaveus]|uniref:helix-turn-helix domain-containing protein n=1 Tax=Streptomyces flaveus TaxID=66370 RepID=UPI004032DF70